MGWGKGSSGTWQTNGKLRYGPAAGSLTPRLQLGRLKCREK